MPEILLDPIPVYAPLLQGGADPISNTWFRWFDQQDDRIAASSHLIQSSQLTGQTASISATDLGILNAGIYQIAWTLRITTAATTSSSIQVGVTYTDDGVTVSQAGPAETGNTTTTVQSGTFIVQTDSNSPVTFATTYASVGATAMAYKIAVQSVRLS